MARSEGNFGFTGSLGNLTAYKRQGSNKVILRTKGGASKNKIRRSPKFAKLRLCQTEFGACSTLGALIRHSIWGIKHLADSYISGHLNAFLKSILNQDTENKPGQRAILVSRYRNLFNGFNLNRQNPFNTVMRHPVSCTLSRDTGTASITIPQLLPGMGFYNPSKYPMYRFIVVLSVIPDMAFAKKQYEPVSASRLFPEYHFTEWKDSSLPAAMQNIELRLKDFKGLTDSNSLFLSMGIEFGYPVSNAVTKAVKYTGSACILSAG